MWIEGMLFWRNFFPRIASLAVLGGICYLELPSTTMATYGIVNVLRMQFSSLLGVLVQNKFKMFNVSLFHRFAKFVKIFKNTTGKVKYYFYTANKCHLF